jgi:hypothetical protein
MNDEMQPPRTMCASRSKQLSARRGRALHGPMTDAQVLLAVSIIETGDVPRIFFHAAPPSRTGALRQRPALSFARLLAAGFGRRDSKRQRPDRGRALARPAVR